MDELVARLTRVIALVVFAYLVTDKGVDAINRGILSLLFNRSLSIFFYYLAVTVAWTLLLLQVGAFSFQLGTVMGALKYHPKVADRLWLKYAVSIAAFIFFLGMIVAVSHILILFKKAVT
ncbi:hypothetical protein [Paracoccus shandongensis]|uniref:hypothetical protein n=1 Tax=Paracoccus shandongensis TaxID=2816048 RepID=UPI001A8F12CF|nr:hypothetical protein [Paracoccus shandongensis]